MVLHSRLEPREQAVPPLTSAALRGTPHCAAEQDSGSRRSPLPGLDADLPGLRSDVSPPWMLGLFRLVSLGLVLLYQRARIPPVIFSPRPAQKMEY